MRNQPYSIFSQRMHRKARRKHFPLRAMFEVTYGCNFNCPHCYIPESFRKGPHDKELKTKEVFSVLDQLKEIGCFYLGFTGGEPFVRGDFLDIARYAKSKGFEIIIYTNGSLINSAEASALKKINPNKIDITINSLKKESFERITQAQGAYDKVLGGIDLLSKRGIRLGFKSCLLRENAQELENILQFAKRYNALYRLDTILMPKLDGSKEPYKYWEKLDASNADCSLTEKTSSIRQNKALFKCGVGVSQVAITPYGELKMCLMIDSPIYKILSTSAASGNNLKIAWQKLKDYVNEIELSANYQCDKCGLSDYCKWCPARSWLENGKFNCCIPELKQRAEYVRLKARQWKNN